MTRPFAETMPAVTVWFRPKGLPIAMTQSPTSSVSESPSSTKGRLAASTLIRAISISWDLPISFASITRPSESATLMSLALSTT